MLAKEIKYLPKASDIDKSWQPLGDLVFVIERFKMSKIIPYKYNIVYSSKYGELSLEDNTIKSLNKLKLLLTNGDGEINNSSLGFLPKSSKQYFTDYYGTSKRYNVDFANQFLGIKHFHLDKDNRNKEVLLYYLTVKNKIYFLKIGDHKDLYQQTIIETIVNEFPELLNDLSIAAMPDMPIGKDYKYSVNEVKEIWGKGGNVSFLINNSYYTSCVPQTFSKLNTQTIFIVQNIYFQIDLQLRRFLHYLNEKYPEKNNDFDIESLTFNCEENILVIGDKITKEAVEIRIDYLANLKFIDDILQQN